MRQQSMKARSRHQQGNHNLWFSVSAHLGLASANHSLSTNLKRGCVPQKVRRWILSLKGRKKKTSGEWPLCSSLRGQGSAAAEVTSTASSWKPILDKGTARVSSSCAGTDDAFNRRSIGRSKQITQQDVDWSRTFCHVCCQQGKLQEETQLMHSLAGNRFPFKPTETDVVGV